MAQQLFDWLKQDQPSDGVGVASYPQAGDIERPGAISRDIYEVPNYERPEHPDPSMQPSPSGAYSPEGVSLLPGKDDAVYREPAPDPDVIGKEGNGSWDYSFEIVPVYAVPPEMGGGEYVGSLDYAPSLPRDLQPIRFVKVPRSGKMM